jgi:hypothetical protein
MAIRFSQNHVGEPSNYRPIDPYYGRGLGASFGPEGLNLNLLGGGTSTTTPLNLSTATVTYAPKTLNLSTGSRIGTQTSGAKPPPAPTCLTAQQVLALGPCFSGVPPKGVSPTALATLCTTMRNQGTFGLPYCPGVPRGKIPACLDAGWLDLLAYAEQYPQADGPNAGKNALTWAARKDPVWYEQAKMTPPCQAASPPPLVVDPTLTLIEDKYYTPPLPEAPPVDPNAKQHARQAWVIGGLLALLVVGGGGAYWYSQRKK